MNNLNLFIIIYIYVELDKTKKKLQRFIRVLKTYQKPIKGVLTILTKLKNKSSFRS